jgi:hypothetical protein
MTESPVTAGASASLFHGAPAVAFVLHTGAHPAYAAMLAALDEHINDLTALKLAAAHERIDRGELTRPTEYDLISGLTGLGLYHLVRHGSADSGMTAAVLDYLISLAEPVRRHGESLPGWWSGTGPAGTPDPAWPGGHLNLGMAHGGAGILALLSGAMRVGIQVEGHAKAVSDAFGPPRGQFRLGQEQVIDLGIQCSSEGFHVLVHNLIMETLASSCPESAESPGINHLVCRRQMCSKYADDCTLAAYLRYGLPCGSRSHLARR